MSALHRHEKHAVMFLLRHLVMGVTGGLVFGGLLLYFDIGHLGSLLGESHDEALTLVLLFFGLSVTFGSVAMGVGIMSQAEDKN